MVCLYICRNIDVYTCTFLYMCVCVCACVCYEKDMREAIDAAEWCVYICRYIHVYTCTFQYMSVDGWVGVYVMKRTCARPSMLLSGVCVYM